MHRNFGGDWTALFVTSADRELPIGLEAHRFHETMGYDGQFYRVLAHDPLLRRVDPIFFDAPALRWRRILTPALAYLVALGRPSWIDPAYVAVTLGFLALGVFWSARFCRGAGLPAWWGAGFVLLPASIISLERMTVDLGLLALAAGFAYLARGPRGPALWAVMALAPLARETGAVLPLACAAEALARRDWRDLGKAVAAGLPGLAWYGWVHTHVGSDPVRFVDQWPLQALLVRTFDWSAVPLEASRQAVAGGLDQLALLGVWAALALSAAAVWTERGVIRWAVGLFCVFPVLLSYPGVWAEAYAFARILSPLALWLALMGFERRRYVGLLPLALMAPRILAQLAPHLLGDGKGWN
ncbi:MAG: hypothetical protein H6509_11670 [Bryobacterales bacterium]|nr:hypothetical protein [Bryobacterales bacterium]